MKKIFYLTFSIAALVGMAVGWMSANHRACPVVIDAEIVTQDNLRGSFFYYADRPVQFSPDGRYVAALAHRKSTKARQVIVPDNLYFWDTWTRKRLKAIRLNNDDETGFFPPTYQVSADGKLYTIRDVPEQTDSLGLLSYDPATDAELEIQRFPRRGAWFTFASDGATLVRIPSEKNKKVIELFDTPTGKLKGSVQLPESDLYFVGMPVTGQNKIIVSSIPRDNLNGTKRVFLVDIEKQSIIRQFDLPADLMFRKVNLEGSKLRFQDFSQDYFIDVATGESRTFIYAHHFPSSSKRKNPHFFTFWNKEFDRCFIVDQESRGQDIILVDGSNRLLKKYDPIEGLTGFSNISHWLPGTSLIALQRSLPEPPSGYDKWYRKIVGWLSGQVPKMYYAEHATLDVETGALATWFPHEDGRAADVTPFPDGQHFLMLRWLPNHFELSVCDAPGKIHWGSGILVGIMTTLVVGIVLQMIAFPRAICAYLIRSFRSAGKRQPSQVC